MSAQPIDYDDPQQRIDPQQILRVLPTERARQGFLAEYQDAARAAIDPAGWSALTTLLQHWSVRAIAMSRPGYAQSGEEAVYVSRLLQATDLITRQPQ
jgi:Family of unknown function (DUF6247)